MKFMESEGILGCHYLGTESLADDLWFFRLLALNHCRVALLPPWCAKKDNNVKLNRKVFLCEGCISSLMYAVIGGRKGCPDFGS